MQNRVLLTEIAEYYSSKLMTHGPTAHGVDWNGEESQQLRFQQLSKIIDTLDHFSINDLGCGYGALYDFLAKENKLFSYAGFDVVSSMIEAAKERHPDNQRARFICASQPDQIADYGVASGIFNVFFNHSSSEWENYLHSTLDILHQASQRGFSFNCLTSYSDHEKRKAHLYYADPCALFDFCRRRYSRNVALLHDYGLYEFTILVRKR